MLTTTNLEHLTDEQLEGARQELASNGSFIHCAECHNVTPIDEACSDPDGYLICQSCMAAFGDYADERQLLPEIDPEFGPGDEADHWAEDGSLTH